MAREAERAGASGFAMVVEDHFYPGLVESPYSIVAGAVNPYSFLPEAELEGFVTEDASAVSKFLLSEFKLEEMTLSIWEWITADDGAAKKYLAPIWKPHMGGVLGLEFFFETRGVGGPAESQRIDTSVQLDSEFLGRNRRLRTRCCYSRGENAQLYPRLLQAGNRIWRHPHLGVHVSWMRFQYRLCFTVANGRFQQFFAFGMRLGRFAAIAATFADADEDQKRKLPSQLILGGSGSSSDRK